MGKPSFVIRFWQYQRERFPILQNGIMITVFTFSAVVYSICARSGKGFIPWRSLAAGVLTSICFFYLLRVFDEFKDAVDDAKFRPYRPVPRGLVSLNELRRSGLVVVLTQVAVNLAIMPRMIIPYGMVLVYMGLMRQEFFVSEWLRKHPIVYLISHMMVMPLIDFYTTGLDWVNNRQMPAIGLYYFLAVTFCNGVVIEIGRKIRSQDAEETGVETYSALWGWKKATIVWLIVLGVTCVGASAASFVAGFGIHALPFLIAMLIGCAIPALRFLRQQHQQNAQRIELAAGIWTVGMYLTLGVLPMVINLLQGLL